MARGYVPKAELREVRNRSSANFRRAEAWKKAAVLLEAANLSSESRKEEMHALAQEAFTAARLLDPKP